MKKISSIFILLLLFVGNNNAQKITEYDTIQLNYFIATGEFGGVNEGLIIYKSNNEIKAKYIKYNVSSYGMPLKADTITSFYRENKNNYSVLKSEWKLTKEEQDYLNNLFNEIKTYSAKGFSNAPEHYVIFSKKQDYVLVDSTGQWNKFLEIKRTLGIEQCPQKL